LEGKGWDLFVDSIATLRDLLPDYRYIIVGSGNEERFLEERIKKLQLGSLITKFSYLPHSELVNIFNAIDILCFPSLRKSESLGLVGLEAMACETIVVSTSGSGPESYINSGKNGFILKHITSKSMAQKIIEITELSEEGIAELKYNASISTKSYDREIISKSFIKSINLILDE